MGTAPQERAMKILYHHRTTASDGGAIHIDGIVGALRELGVEVRIVGPAVASARAREGVSRRWVAALRRRMPRWLHEFAEMAYNVPEFFTVARAIRKFAPDLVYQRANLFLLSSLWAARRAGLPLLTEINAPFALERNAHGGLALSRVARWSDRVCWQGADAVVVVTEVMAELAREAGVAADRVHVMPNGVGPELLAETAVVPGAKAMLRLSQFTVLGFTGFVRAWNGLHDVVRLLDAAGRRNWFLLIVGDGPARADLERLAHSLGVADRVRFTGVLPRSELARHVSAFDVALQPAANPYASPLKLFEYMALGRAIVAPDQPNIREVLSDGEDALLFSPGEHRSLESCLDRLANDPSLRQALGERARASLRRFDFTWRRNAERVITLARRMHAERMGAAASLATAEGAFRDTAAPARSNGTAVGGTRSERNANAGLR